MVRTVILAVAVTLVACMGPQIAATQDRAERLMKEGKPEEAIEALEEVVEAYPQDPRAHDALGTAYRQAAQMALDGGHEEEYTRYLGLAFDEYLESLRLDPEASGPHTGMGIVTIYQGDIDASLINFKNAFRLAPDSPIAASNLAEIYVYLGKNGPARRALERARRHRLPPSIAERVELMLAWRQGDLTEARDLLSSIQSLDPNELATWNDHVLPEPIGSLEEFAGYCCGDPSCGPYFKDACHDMELAVAERELRAETARKELLLEMERRRKLEEIYRSRKDLHIEIEKPE